MNRTEKSPGGPIKWNIDRDEYNGISRWHITANEGIVKVILIKALPNHDGTWSPCSDGLYNYRLKSNGSLFMSTNDLRNLCYQILSCMTEAHVNRLYAHPENRAVKALFTRLHAQQIPDSDIFGIGVHLEFIARDTFEKIVREY